MGQDDLHCDAGKYPPGTCLRAVTPDGVVGPWHRELMHLLMAGLLAHPVKPQRIHIFHIFMLPL